MYVERSSRGLKKKQSLLVIIEGKEKYKMEKILNKESLERRIGIWCNRRDI